jgi:hypothetical protein
VCTVTAQLIVHLLLHQRDFGWGTMNMFKYTVSMDGIKSLPIITKKYNRKRDFGLPIKALGCH